MQQPSSQRHDWKPTACPAAAGVDGARLEFKIIDYGHCEFNEEYGQVFCEPSHCQLTHQGTQLQMSVLPANTISPSREAGRKYSLVVGLFPVVRLPGHC